MGWGPIAAANGTLEMHLSDVSSGLRRKPASGVLNPEPRAPSPESQTPMGARTQRAKAAEPRSAGRV
jgi:hypothetical protein